MMPMMMPPPLLARPGRAYSVDTAMQAKQLQEQEEEQYDPQWRGRSKCVRIDEDGIEHSDKVDDDTLEQELLECYDCQNEDYSVFDTGNKIATWKKKGSRVAIKRTFRSSLQAASEVDREINILSKCQDASIPFLVESLELEKVIWTVIEHKPAQTIRELVTFNGPMTDTVLKASLNGLFSGIASLFMGGFAHLRITDKTVCLDDSQQIVITNFHYACEYQTGSNDTLYAATQEKFSDDIYTAPEVFANISYNARKATVWSCGVLLYYMVTGQTEKLSNLHHPSFDPTPLPNSDITNTPTPRRRASSVYTIINYPGSLRFEIPNYARWILPRMLVPDPLRRAELIEVASRVPKDYESKDTRPLMELAWLDYKHHVGPYAGWEIPEVKGWGISDGSAFQNLGSSASSIYSMASAMSNPFRSLLGKGDRRRKSVAVGPGVGGPSMNRW